MVTHPSTNPARPGLTSELVCLPSLFLEKNPSHNHHPPLPTIFYSQCFPFTLDSRVTANIEFLVIIIIIIIIICSSSAFFVGIPELYPILDKLTTHARCFPLCEDRSGFLKTLMLVQLKENKPRASRSHRAVERSSETKNMVNPS